MLYSSLKPEGYLVTGPEIRLKYVVKNSQFKGLARVSDTRDHMPETRGEILSEVNFYVACQFNHWKSTLVNKTSNKELYLSVKTGAPIGDTILLSQIN